MTDLLSVSIWLLLSWLIRQVENGIGNSDDDELQEQEDGNQTGPERAGEEEEQQELGIEEIQIEPYEPITQAIKIAIAAFSLLLLGLSISAYKKTGLRRILYAAVAFGLFALQMLIDYLEEAVPAFETPYTDIIFFGITLAILVLFFMAIVRKK
jgi:hypothetical protein